MNTRHAVTKLQGYEKLPADRENYKIENNILENEHGIQHLMDEIHNMFIIMKDNSVKLGDAYYNIWSKYTGFTSLRSGHLIDHIHPPNRKVYDIEKNVFNFEEALKKVVVEDLCKNQIEMVKNGVSLANSYHSNLLMIDMVSIQEFNKKEAIIEKLNKNITDISNNLQESVYEIITLKNQLKAINDKNIDDVKKIILLENRIAVLNVSLEEEEKTINEKLTEIKSLKNTINKFQNEELKLNLKIEEIKKKSYNDLKLKMEEIVQLQSDLLYYQNRSTILDNNNKEWRERLKKATIDISNLEVNIDILNKTISNNNIIIKTFQDNEDKKTTDLQEKIIEISSLQKKNIILTNNLEDLSNNKYDLEMDLNDKIKKNDELLQITNKNKITINDLSNSKALLLGENTLKNKTINNVKINFENFIELKHSFVIPEWIPKEGSKTIIKTQIPKDRPNIHFYGCIFEETDTYKDWRTSTVLYQDKDNMYCIFALLIADVTLGEGKIKISKQPVKGGFGGGLEIVKTSSTKIRLFRISYGPYNDDENYYQLKGYWNDTRTHTIEKDFHTAFDDIKKNLNILVTYWDNGTWNSTATNINQAGIGISHIYGAFSINYDDATKEGYIVDARSEQANKTLKEEIKKLNDDQAKKSILINYLTDDITELQNQVKTKDQIIKTKDEKASEQEEEAILNLTQALDKIKEKQNTIANLEAQNKLSANNIELLKKQKTLHVKETENTVRNLNAAIDKQIMDISSNSKKIKDLEKNLSNMTRARDSYKDEYDRIKKKLDDLENNPPEDAKWKEIYRLRWLELKEEIKIKDATILKLNNEITGLKLDITFGNTSGAKLAQDKIKLNDKIKQLEKEKIQLKKDVEYQKVQVSYHMDERWKEQQVCKSVKAKVKELEEKITLQKNTIDSQKLLIDGNQGNCDDLQEKIVDLSRNVATNMGLLYEEMMKYNNLFDQSNNFLIDRWIPDSSSYILFTFNSEPKFTSCVFRVTDWLSKPMVSCGVYQNPPGGSKWAIFWTGYKRGGKDKTKKTVIAMVKVRYSSRAIRATDARYGYSSLHLHQFIARTNQPQYMSEIVEMFDGGTGGDTRVVGSETGASTTVGYGISDIMGIYY